MLAKSIASILLLIAAVSRGQTAPATRPLLDFGMEGLPIPQATTRNVTSPRTVELLSEAVGREQGVARAQIVRDLGACKLPAGLTSVRLAMTDADSMVRAEAVRAAAMIGDPAIISALQPLVRDPDATVRREAVLAGSVLKDPQFVTAGLKDQSAAVVRAALASAGTPAHADAIAAMLPELRQGLEIEALQTLGRIGATSHASAVALFLNRSVGERTAALRALAGMKAAGEAPAVIRTLEDPHPTVRREAVAALSSIAKDPERQRLAMRMLADTDLTVREEAARLLAAAPTPQAIDVLKKQLDEAYPPLHDAAREALVAIGAEAAPVAGALLSRSDPRRREDGSYILGRLRSPHVLERHTAMLNDSDWGVVAQTAKSLGQIGGREAQSALGAWAVRIPKLSEQIAAHELPAAYRAAAEVLIASARLRETAALPPAKAISASDRARYPTTMRAASLFALGLLDDSSNEQTCNLCLSIYDDRFELLEAKFEALKTLGQLRCAQAATRLKEISENDPSVPLRWIAHWAHDRIAGVVTPFDAPVSPWSADVSLIDIKGEERDASLELSLQLGPLCPPDAWVPLRVVFTNPGDTAIQGQALLPIGDDHGGVEIRVPASVPPRSRRASTAYAYFPPAGRTPGLAIAEWFDSKGKRVARGEVLGRGISNAGHNAEAARASGLVLEIGGDSESAPSASLNPARVSELLATVAGATLAVQSIPEDLAPRDRAGYDACQFIVFSGPDPDVLDMAQRQALLNYVTGGGTLIVSSDALAGIDFSRSWLAPFVPLSVVGRRQTTGIGASQNAGSFHFKQYVPLMEAVASPTDGASDPTREVVLDDGKYVHAAFKSVGLGRVAFTSFPIDSLDAADPNAVTLYRRLLSSGQPGLDWRATKLLGEGERLSGLMIGSPSPPWTIAAAVTIGYLLFVAAVQCIRGGVRRPAAFGIVTIGAAVISMTLAGAANFRQRGLHPMGACIATVHMAPGGGGVRQELLTYLGADDESFGLRASTPSVILRPVVSRDNEPPVVQTSPFAAPRAGLHAAEIKRIWSASGMMSPDQQVAAVAAFGPDGLSLTIDNAMGGTLHAPLLLWGDAFPLPDAAVGRSVIVPLGRNGPGDYTNSSVFASDTVRLRGAIIEAAMTPSDEAAVRALDQPREEAAPQLLAWLAQVSASRLVDTSVEMAMRSEALVRTPVKVLASPAGGRVKIDGGFCRVTLGEGAASAYDMRKREWAASEAGQWLVGFSAPPQVGRLKPLHVTLTADVTAPQQTIRFSRGQCQEGQPRKNSAGETVASWTVPIGRQNVSFACRPEDYDQHGRVWLLMDVANSVPGGSSGLVSPWQFRRLEMSYDAEVIGPPAR